MSSRHYKPGEVPPLLNHPFAPGWDTNFSEDQPNRRRSLRLDLETNYNSRPGPPLSTASSSSVTSSSSLAANSISARIVARRHAFRARMSMASYDLPQSVASSNDTEISTRKRRLSQTEDTCPSVSDDDDNAQEPKRMRRDSEYLESASMMFSASQRTLPPPPPPPSPPPYLADFREGFALMRSASMSSLRSNTSSEPSERSALYKMKDWGMSIPFNIPDTIDTNYFLPLTVSFKNNMYFTRGNRVHVKPWSRQSNHNQDIAQICRIEEKYGEVKLLGCSQLKEEVVIGTTKGTGTSAGTVLLVDVETQSKPTWSWRTSNPIGAVEWHGNLVTVGAANDGVIKFYDVRTRGEGGRFNGKMKSESRKLSRHQGRITKLGWNKTGQMLASGDENGVVYCWDDRTRAPLEVGDHSSRRKKMKHTGAVSALTWHPTETTTLGTADTNGVIRLWNVSSKQSDNRRGPGTYETDSRVVNLHFSPDFKDELITVHGRETHGHQILSNPLQNNTANSLLALTFPRLSHIVSKSVFDAENSHMSRMLSMGVAGPNASRYWPGNNTPDYGQSTSVVDREITGSVMVNGGTKVVVAVPKEGSLKVWDVWGKYDSKEAKQSKRQLSLRQTSRQSLSLSALR
ncbi:hypothetical protein K435DRAFT_835816 [Dendrothele bispora CBS 962.96]|uniref:Uncharacterized protein n=1 Tax=Dendrothele bispora (strain CBS 962.96) TaxID=1314807 RepID=A0A4S8MKZ1_DENBC|nr:hypothetical protein K435DRAFT_835816 [Dendrothele bispora CBS 962.96]